MTCVHVRSFPFDECMWDHRVSVSVCEIYVILYTDEDLLSDEVKSEVALQVIGVKKLLEGSKDIDPKTVYSTICKVRNHRLLVVYHSELDCP